MKLTKEGRHFARELFASCMVDERLDADRVRKAVALVAKEKPRNYLAILEAFLRLVRMELAKHQAVVESAVTLGEDTKDGLVRELKAKYGQDLEVEFRVQAALMGGLRIKVGSDVWDGSIQSRLARLNQVFNVGASR